MKSFELYKGVIALWILHWLELHRFSIMPCVFYSLGFASLFKYQNHMSWLEFFLFPPSYNLYVHAHFLCFWDFTCLSCLITHHHYFLLSWSKTESCCRNIDNRSEVSSFIWIESWNTTPGFHFVTSNLLLLLFPLS